MIELLLYLATHLAFLFSVDGFRFVDSGVSASFGGDAFVVLESSDLRIRLTWDRAQLLMEFQPIVGKPGEWFSPGLLRGLLGGERGDSEVLDAEWGKILEAAIPVLCERLRDPAQVEDVVQGLREQARLRSKELFG